MLLSAQTVNIRPVYEWMLKDITNFKLSIDTTDYSDYYICIGKEKLIRLDSSGIIKNDFHNNTFPVNVYKRRGNDLIFVGETQFRGTYEMPRPTAKIGNQVTGKVNKDTLLNSHITADFFKYKINLNYGITSFDIMVIRNKKSLLITTCNGDSISNEAKQMISKETRSGDQILVYNIYTNSYYFLNQVLNSISVTIE
jgi:hypothetical protein